MIICFDLRVKSGRGMGHLWAKQPQQTPHKERTFTRLSCHTQDNNVDKTGKALFVEIMLKVND